MSKDKNIVNLNNSNAKSQPNQTPKKQTHSTGQENSVENVINQPVKQTINTVNPQNPKQVPTNQTSQIASNLTNQTKQKMASNAPEIEKLSAAAIQNTSKSPQIINPQDSKIMQEKLPEEQIANIDKTASIDIKEKEKSLDELLVEKGYISTDQLNVAQKEMHAHGSTKLGEMLVSMGFITETALGEAFSKTSGIEKFDIKSIVLDTNLIKQVPKEIAMKYKVIPVDKKNDIITVAVHDVFDVVALDKIKKYFSPNIMIEPVYCVESDILDIIDQYYDYEMSLDGILKEIEDSAQGLETESASGEEDFRNPVVRLVDSFLIDAVHCNASDIHFEPEENFLRVRYRIDGRMKQIKAFH